MLYNVQMNERWVISFLNSVTTSFKLLLFTSAVKLKLYSYFTVFFIIAWTLTCNVLLPISSCLLFGEEEKHIHKIKWYPLILINCVYILNINFEKWKIKVKLKKVLSHNIVSSKAHKCTQCLVERPRRLLYYVYMLCWIVKYKVFVFQFNVVYLCSADCMSAKCWYVLPPRIFTSLEVRRNNFVKKTQNMIRKYTHKDSYLSLGALDCYAHHMYNIQFLYSLYVTLTNHWLIKFEDNQRKRNRTFRSHSFDGMLWWR